jgi:hypothetical protein
MKARCGMWRVLVLDDLYDIFVSEFVVLPYTLRIELH